MNGDFLQFVSSVPTKHYGVRIIYYSILNYFIHERLEIVKCKLRTKNIFHLIFQAHFIFEF